LTHQIFTRSWATVEREQTARSRKLKLLRHPTDPPHVQTDAAPTRGANVPPLWVLRWASAHPGSSNRPSEPRHYDRSNNEIASGPAGAGSSLNGSLSGAAHTRSWYESQWPWATGYPEYSTACTGLSAVVRPGRGGTCLAAWTSPAARTRHIRTHSGWQTTTAQTAKPYHRGEWPLRPRTQHRPPEAVP